MRRRRYQKGSLQCRKQGKRKVWVVLYYDIEGRRQYQSLGMASKMTKGDAEAAQQAFMRDINGGGPTEGTIRPPLLSEFLDETYLPFYRGKWKESTKGTTEGRIRTHIRNELGCQQLHCLCLTSLQQWLEVKARTGNAKSVVKHLRWDLRSIFRMAVAERLIPTNPAESLYCPKMPSPAVKPAMTATEVRTAIEALQPRERTILQLAVFAGMRPGELLALQRRDIVANGTVAEIRRRVYRGKFDVPKNGKFRDAAIPPDTAARLTEWMDVAVGRNLDAFIFCGATGQPLWRDSLLEDHMRPALEPHGLKWIDFQVMRATHASLGTPAKADVKVMSDQRGHGLGIAMDVYVRSSIEQKQAAVTQLERWVLPNVVPMEKAG